jgi:DNA-3-methyladenine glycosylase
MLLDTVLESIKKARRLSKGFYGRNALEVAKDLLGLVLCHETGDGLTAGIITEVEAYIGPKDKACHAYGGRRTKRNELMYGPPGFAYIYFTYGMHFCFNVVVAAINQPHAVLVRSIQPICGQDIMMKRRKNRFPLASGPGRLCQAMAIDRSHNGADLELSDLFICQPPFERTKPFEILETPRIGIDYAGEASTYPWRFLIKDKVTK